MLQDSIKKLEAMGLDADPEFAKAVESAETIEDIIAIFASKGITVTADDFKQNTSSDDEISEDMLESVAGGALKIGFFNGYSKGMSGQKSSGGGPLYQLGYKCGRMIGGWS